MEKSDEAKLMFLLAFIGGDLSFRKRKRFEKDMIALKNVAKAMR